MPYIIETWRWEGSGGREKRAVATLEEAQAALHDAAHGPCAPLSESGGTVGPLSDGTVIEVRRVG